MKRICLFLLSALLLCGCFGFAACGGERGQSYAVTLSNEEGELICSDAARAGELVTVETGREGYTVHALYVDGKRIEGNRFVMPERDVSVMAVLSNGSALAHTVSVSETGECGRTVADRSDAEAGETVTLTTYAAYGCSLSQYLVNGAPIEGNTFEMPDRDVVVTVLYRELPETDVEFTVTQSYQRATSRWYAGYTENGFSVDVVVDDNILFTLTDYLESFAYADNIEFIFGKKTEETGWNGRYKVIVGAAGDYEIRSYKNGWTYLSNFDMNVTVLPCTLQDNGFNGYRVNVFIPYSALGLTYKSALGNLSIAPAMRNTLNGLKTTWGSFMGMHCNWNDSKTHLTVAEDGSFVPGDFSVKALFAGDGLFSLERWGGFYSDVGALGDVWSISEAGRDTAYWSENFLEIASYKPETVYFSAGLGDRTPLSAFSEFISFAEQFEAALPKAKLVVVSPVPSLADADFDAVCAYSAMLRDYIAVQKGLRFVDLCGAVCKGRPNRNLYASSVSLSEEGYALLGKLIREEKGVYTGIGGATWGDSGAYVATGEWIENSGTLTLRSDGVRKIFCRTPFTGDFSVSLRLNASQVYNGDAYPKFGFTLQNEDRSHAFYISGENALTAKRAGFVPCVLGTFVWNNSSETAVPDLSYAGGQFATLRLERTGNSIAFYVNETCVYAGDLGYGKGEAVVGLFSFNTALNIRNWEITGEEA